LEQANVAAGFDNQDDADEALLRLRIAGFRDGRIGYYYPAARGRMTDLLARHHHFAGAVIGAIVGAVLGAWGALLLARWDALDWGVDPIGLATTCGVFGALFLGTVGGMIELRTGVAGTFTPDGPTPSFVLAVDAGDRADQARSILREYGGFDVRPPAASDEDRRVSAVPI